MNKSWFTAFVWSTGKVGACGSMPSADYKPLYYDLISGKVNEVDYQPGAVDQFYHRYEYDAENRITDVYTTDNKAFVGNKNLEEHEAFYEYYKHGPLARAVIGQQEVQGIDYAYTLEGWLKGVNSNTLQAAAGTGVLTDMGGDGVAGSPNQFVGQDAYGFSLNYFTGEYAPINAGLSPFPGFSGLMPSGYYNPLYNGNISAMAVNIGKLNAPLLYNYQYDQLNRIVGMDAFTGLNQVSNTFSPLTTDGSYQERATYDANGNIKTYFRNGTTNGGTPLAMDNLTYNYNLDGNGHLSNNKLTSVNDPVPAGNYPNDIDNQSANNYGYDAIGNMTSDNAGGISNITWTVYGKISSIAKTDGSSIAYTYDAGGNRISKTVTPNGGPPTTTWYVRDASGNTMAVYTVTGTGVLTQSEQHLYGSSRLGIYNRNINADAAPPAGINANLIGSYVTSAFARGNKNYELSNHLGNVLVTVSDKKIGMDTNNDGTIDFYMADVVTANDYYPFGSLMPGRTYSVANTNYRYGFNGKENDNDIGVGDQDYGARIYDGRLGRFLSVDPLEQEYPELSTYQFSSNSPISNIDRDGNESEDASDALENLNEETERERYQNLTPSEDREPPPPRGPQGRVVTKPGLSGTVRKYIELNFNSEEALDNLRDILGEHRIEIFNLPKAPEKTPGDEALDDLSTSSNPTDRENAARLKRLAKLTFPKDEKVKQTKNATTDAKVIHRNSNNAEGNVSLYDLHAEGENRGELLKIGKANADDISPTTGQPKRFRASERAAQKKGYPNATVTLRKNLGRTTTREATDAEAKEIKQERATGKKLPLNRERSKKYKE